MSDLPDAKLLRKKLKNGLIVDKWDLVTIIEKQQKQIDMLQKQVKGYQTSTEHYRNKAEDDDWKRTREYCS